MTPAQYNRHIADIWLQAWLAVARAEVCHERTAPAKWADTATEEYAKRFPAKNLIARASEVEPTTITFPPARPQPIVVDR